eukprot:7380178-Prymnesium_polylepis.1
MAALGGPSLVRVCCRGAPTKLHVLAREQPSCRSKVRRRRRRVGAVSGEQDVEICARSSAGVLRRY